MVEEDADFFGEIADSFNYDQVHFSCFYCNDRFVNESQLKVMDAWVVKLGGPSNASALIVDVNSRSYRAKARAIRKGRSLGVSINVY